jgi:hypothetical protein
MTELASKDVHTFEPGDTFRIRFSASDDNGVAHAEIKFRNTSNRPVTSIRREMDLGGESEVTFSFDFEVDERLAPGHYVCEYIALTDKLGNTSLFTTPGIEFRIEGNEKVHEGPALLNWSFG